MFEKGSVTSFYTIVTCRGAG